MQHCPHCGERVEPEDAYCFECGTALGESPERDGATRSGQDRDREGGRHRGRAPPSGPAGDPARGQGREPAGGQHTGREDTSGRVESLTTLRVAAALAVVSMLENVATILFAEELVEFVQSDGVGFGQGVSTDAIVIQGGLGIAVAFGVVGLCVYYYRQGYVDRAFFWILVVTGILGFFIGGGLSVILFIALGAYGLLVVLRRDRPAEPARGVDRR